MDSYEQITKLAEAAMLIQEVANACDPEFADTLQDTADNLADIADQIEGAE
jgi:hypothetical protein